jgi:hypothetical protein
MVAGLLAAGAGIAGGLGDYFGGKSAAKAQEQFLQALLQQSSMGFNEALWGQFAQKQKKSIKAADKIAGKQYKAQRRHLGSQLHQQLSDIKAGGQQASADAAQSAASRGLYNTTVLDSLQRGVGYDVARQSGQARAQYGGALAALEGQKFGTQQKLGLMQAVGPIQEPSVLGSLGTGLQAGMGAFDLAGGFGGGGMDFGQMLSQGVSGQYGQQMALKMMLAASGLGG